MIDIVGKRYLYFLVSLIIIIPGLISLFIPPHLNVGIDFTGGTIWEVVPKGATPADTNAVSRLLTGAGIKDPAVQNAELIVGTVHTPTLIMRMPNISPEEKEKLVGLLVDNNIVAGTKKTTTIAPSVGVTTTGTLTGTGTVSTTGTLSGTAGSSTGAAGTTTTTTLLESGTEVAFDTVGPTVGSEVAGRAVGAVALASLGILAYLWYAFRRVPNPLRYAVCAIAALLHDVFVVLGIFSILGRFVPTINVDALFITAMLTVIGFSVHDTIVVFDRIRENILKRRFDTFDKVVNYSLVQTLTRSVNTSLTVIFTLFALFLFGGSSIRNFVLALLVGIISGTYSSIFNASLLLVVWENKEWRNWFGGRGRAAEAGGRARTA
ncbi:MAG: protein translocase subunit SecF [Chloroflexota bacterium]|nr:protein translocase subunit SecF [Chloroflexota bacterium]